MSDNNREIIDTLIRDGKTISDYLVILSDNGNSDTLYNVYENILFYVMIDNDALYWKCVDYIKAHGACYKSKEELKKLRPEIICS